MSKQTLTKEDQQKLYLRDVVMRQTEYTEEQAINKLQEYKYDVIAVVRDFMGINTNKIEAPVKSVNQQIYGEIRNMMDDAASKYRIKKEIDEKRELIMAQRRAVYERVKRCHIAAYKIQKMYRKALKNKVVEISISD
tara:strand:- start:333 stop:743 length:411 start_codon:yes stop_codon:yes gene_type:complete